MCTMQAIRKGFQDIAANKKAVLLVWLTSLVLTLAVALPILSWLAKMNHLTAASAMLEGFSLPLLLDLARYDFSSLFRMVGALVLWLVLSASLISTFVSGGILAVLAAPGHEPFLERFFGGAGRYFLRFLRLLLGAGLSAGVVLLALNVLVALVVEPVLQEASELTLLMLALAQGTVSFLIGTVFLLALHYARIETVVEGRTGMVRAYLDALSFVVTNLLRVFALLVFFVAMAAAAYLVYALVRNSFPATTWLLILVLLIMQQMAVLARSAFQVGLYGAELELFLLRRPTPSEPAATAAVSTREPDLEGLARTDTD